jgi:ADP-heptose:LPS heptosyltransferase
LALASRVRRRRPLPSAPERIGVISPTAIGDLILESGVLVNLSEAFPAAELHLFHGASNAAVVPLLPVAVTSHICNFTDAFGTVSKIRKSRPELLFDLTPWPRLTALYAACSGAVTVGFNSAGQFRHYAFDVAVPHLQARHELDNLAALSRVFAPYAPYRAALRDERVKPVRALPYERLVLCHVSPGGSRARDKSWPVPYWVELTRRLAGQGFAIGFTGTKADLPNVEPILAAADLPRSVAFSLCGELSLGELAFALRAARLLITVDTGVLHLASAIGAPALALHGPTRAARWGGRSVSVTSLDSPHPDAGFVHFGFESNPHGFEVMAALGVDAVFATAARLLGASISDEDLPPTRNSAHSPPRHLRAT